LLYIDSFVSHPGWAQTLPLEYVLLARGSVRTAAPLNLSSDMPSHPFQGPRGHDGSLVPSSNRLGERFIPPVRSAEVPWER